MTDVIEFARDGIARSVRRRPIRLTGSGRPVVTRLTSSRGEFRWSVAPNVRATLGRDSAFDGCYGSDRSKSDKHITLTCRVQW